MVMPSSQSFDSCRDAINRVPTDVVCVMFSGSFHTCISLSSFSTRRVLFVSKRLVALQEPLVTAYMHCFYLSQVINDGGCFIVSEKKGRLVPGLAIAILVPGVRGAAVMAAGLTGLVLRRFLIGLTLGSLLFLSLHFFLGYAGGSVLFALGRILPLTTSIPLVLALLAVVYALWVVAVRRQKAARAELQAAQSEQDNAAALEVWHEGICPVCLALYTANQLRSFTSDRPLL